jgi:lysyl-tRNA synthetase class 1
MHETIYAAKEESGLQPGDAFKALYRLILNKDSGPKAGWFLASLDQSWLISRLRQEA